MAAKAATILVGVAWVAQPRTSSAADTTEPFAAAGLTDAEAHGSYEGLGRPEEDRILATELVLGFGVTERFSLSAAGAFETNLEPAGGASAYGIRAFGLLLDTDPFDLDLMLAAELADLSELILVPAVELNLDHHPDKETVGLYLRAGVAIARQLAEGSAAEPSAEEKASEAAAPPLTAAAVLNPGLYCTVAEGHQLLAEYDTTIELSERDPAVDIGGVAVGYNVAVASALELINQVYLDIPSNGEAFGVGLGVGAILTLPAVGPAGSAGPSEQARRSPEPPPRRRAER